MSGMVSSPQPADPHTGDPLARSVVVGHRSVQLIALSDVARAQLHALDVPASSAGEGHPAANQAADTTLPEQMDRCHVFVVNSDPAFLEAVRGMLQSNRYNVTSTNLVPQTFAMVHAAGADALVIDLATGETELWELVDHLMADEQTRQLPVVFTASDPQMLDQAETHPWPSGGRFHLLKPFDPTLLGDVIHALIGPA
jgi:CheY-like chemotaxis protein